MNDESFNLGGDHFARRNPVRRKSHTKLERIVEAAVQLLEKYKANEISVALVSEASGVNRTTIYDFFESTDAIFDEVARRYIVESNSFVSNGVKSLKNPSVFELIDMTIDLMVDYYGKFPKRGIGIVISSFLYNYASDPEYYPSSVGYWYDHCPECRVIDEHSNYITFANVSVIISSLLALGLQREDKPMDKIKENIKLAARGYLSSVIESLFLSSRDVGKLLSE